ncbi:MAG: C25 family cysteine peptidase [Candidatus Zixiibacteriota bacterium]
MIKRFCVLIAILAALAFSAVEVESYSDNSMTIRMSSTPEINGSGFDDAVQIYIDGADYHDITGEPRLPVFREIILIPEDCELVVHPQDRIVQKLSIPNIVEPVPVFETQGQKSREPFTLSQKYYQDNNINSHPAEIIQQGKIHGWRYALVEFRPVAYNPVKSEIEIINEMEINISYRGGNWPEDRYNSPVFNKILHDIALNPFEVEPMPENPIGYYVICPDEYIAEVEPLLEWRRQMGYHVMVSSPESLGGTRSSIKDAISEQYLFGDVVPDYIVFVGDVDVIPTYPSGGSESPTDADYCTVDGADFIPDILYGRISGADADDIARIANRVVEYEKLDYDDISFTNRVLLGTTDDRSFHDYVHIVHHHCVETWIEPADVDWTELDGPSTDMAEVIDEIDSGYNIFYYYGHGSPSGFASPPLNFDGIDALSNDEKYPFMVGNACSTNDYTDDESWGEALLRRDNKGAIAYMGASDLTYWYPDSIWEIETFAALYEHGYSTVDGICYYALVEVNIGMPSYGHYFFDVYNLVGDPATHLWKKMPAELAVECTPAFVPGDTNDIAIDVTSDGMPVENALVGLRFPSGNLAAYTDDSGHANLAYLAETPDDVKLTVTKPDYIPVQDTLIATSLTEPYIYISSSEIFDAESLSTVNNSNGILEIGETAILRLNLQNYGIDATGISIMTDCERYLSLDASEYATEDLASMASANLEMVIDVEEDVSDGEIAEINFEIMADGGYSDIQPKQFAIGAPDLQLLSSSFSDVEGGDGDFVLEDGEVVEFSFQFVNNGTGSPNEIDVEIIEDAAYIERIVTSYSFGPVYAGSLYTLSIEANIVADAPEGSSALFTISQNYLSSSWEDTSRIYFNIPGYETEVNPSEGWSATGFHLDNKTFASPPYSLKSTPSGQIFYDNDAEYYAESPYFMVPMNSSLTFWHKISTPVMPTSGDFGRVLIISETDTAQLGDDIMGQIDEWELVRLNIPTEFQNRSAKLRFEFISSGANYRRGWNIDDIKVKPSGLPQLGAPKVTPLVAMYSMADDSFTYSIKYASADGAMPEDPIMLHIGSHRYEMEFFGGSLIDGAIFQKKLVVESAFATHFEMGDITYPESGSITTPFVSERVFYEDFEDGIGDFYVEGDDDWQHTFLEEGAYSGNFCFSTLGPSFGGYDSEANSRLVLPFEARRYTPILVFYARYDFACGSSSGLIRDGGNVKIRTDEDGEFIVYPTPLYDGEIISSINPMSYEPVYGEDNYNEWRMFYVDLTDMVPGSFDIIFDFGSNDIETDDGWFIDDVAIYIGSMRDVEEPGIQKPEKANISVSPNPFNSAATIDFDGFEPEIIEIFDNSGHLIKSYQSPGKSLMWQPGDIESGVYIISAEKGKKSENVKALYVK